MTSCPLLKLEVGMFVLKCREEADIIGQHGTHRR